MPSRSLNINTRPIAGLSVTILLALAFSTQYSCHSLVLLLSSFLRVGPLGWVERLDLVVLMGIVRLRGESIPLTKVNPRRASKEWVNAPL